MPHYVVIPPDGRALSDLNDVLETLKAAGFTVRVGVAFKSTLVIQVSPVDVDENGKVTMGAYMVVTPTEMDQLIRAPRYANKQAKTIAL